MGIFDRKDIYQAVLILWNFLRIEEEPKKSDAIFVFGCTHLRVPKRAAELFHQGIAPKILVTGAMGKSASVKYGKSESDVFYEELIKQHVPSHVIILEQEATNTGENIMFGIRKLREHGIDPRMICFVSQPYHSLRCKATFRLREPSIMTCSCPPPGLFTDFIPFTEERFALRMVGEIDRLIQYPKEGLIDDPGPIPLSVLQAAELIRKNVKE